MKQTAMMRRLAVLVGTALVAVLALSGVAWAATAPLAVTKTTPGSGATEVSRTVNIKAYFNHDMKTSTFTSSTFKIRKQGTTSWLGATRSVNNTISPTSTNGSSQSVATLNPNSDLVANTTYQVMVLGGSSGVKDLNGNALGANKSWTFKTVDTIAPAAPAITSPQQNGFVGASFTLSGTAEPNATVEVLEGTTSKGTTKANGSGAWSKALSGVSEGSHTYTAKATDAAGNTSSASNARTVKVDTRAPSVPAITSPADNSYDNDGIFTLSGTAETNSTVTILEGTTSKGTTQTDTQGNWSKALSGVADGSHAYTAKASDAAGNTSTASNARTVKVDSQPPNAPVITDPADNSYDNDGDFTVSGTAEANSTVELFEGTTSKGTTQADAQGNWSKQLTGVADGDHTYTAKATDAAGNISALSNARTLTVDTTPPDVNNVSPASGATGVSPTTNVTATFSEAMNSTSISDQSFTLSKSGTLVTAQVTFDENSRTATLNPAADLQAGATYDAKIATSVKDLAGNTLVQEETWSFTVEPPPPLTITPNPLDFTPGSRLCSGTVTKTVTITNNTANQVDLYPSVTNATYSVAGDVLQIASGESFDLSVSWTAPAGAGFARRYSGQLVLKDAAENTVGTSDLTAVQFCPIEG